MDTLEEIIFNIDNKELEEIEKSDLYYSNIKIY